MPNDFSITGVEERPDFKVCGSLEDVDRFLELALRDSLVDFGEAFVGGFPISPKIVEPACLGHRSQGIVLGDFTASIFLFAYRDQVAQANNSFKQV